MDVLFVYEIMALLVCAVTRQELTQRDEMKVLEDEGAVSNAYHSKELQLLERTV